MFFSFDLINKVTEIINLAAKKQIMIAGAESCTGGLLSALFTEISGSSKVFERGFVVYSNQAKSDLLKIDAKLIDNYGAISSEIAQEMAIKAVENSLADLSIAITGIAGSDNNLNNEDSNQKPAGLVFISSLNKNNNKLVTRQFNFAGSRYEIRKQSLLAALEILKSQLQFN
jgi:PncC family amidohydrolase